MLRPALLLSALALAACAGSATPVAQADRDLAYVEGGGRFSTGTRLTVRAGTFREAGRLGVCAAWATDGLTAMVKPHLSQVLGIGVLQLGGRNVLQGFAPFPRAPSREALASAPPGCVLTDQAWRPDFAGLAPEIAFGRMALERDEEDGVVVSFAGD